MGWSGTFVEDLSQSPHDPIFIIDFVNHTHSTGTSTPGQAITLASHPGYGDIVGLGLSVAFGGSTLNCHTWQYTAGTCDITFHSEHANHLTAFVRRGQIVRVLMGFQENATTEFEPVFLGRLQNVIGRSPSWTVKLDDATTLLQTRWSGGSTIADSFSLFNKVGKATTISSSWSTSDSTMSVASVSSLDKATGLVGAVKIDNGSDDPFYLHYSGTSSGTISGITTGKRGTTAANSSSGDVYDVATLYGNPLDIYLRLLLSDGTGTGTYNIYPAEWGYMIPEEYVDISDVLGQSSASRWSPSYNIRLYVDDSQTAPYQWLQSWTRLVGYVPVVRQGQFSIRAIQSPNAGSNFIALDGSLQEIHITDSDIIDLQWSGFHPDFQVQYQKCSFKKTDGTERNVGAVATNTFPNEYQLLYDTSDILWPGNENGIIDGVGDQVRYWGLWVPYDLQIDCAGLRLAQLCVGDLVLLTSEQIKASLQEYGAADVWVEREAMVLGIAVDFTAGMVSLSLGIIPEGSATT
jgi:hypothetical protein